MVKIHQAVHLYLYIFFYVHFNKFSSIWVRIKCFGKKSKSVKKALEHTDECGKLQNWSWCKILQWWEASSSGLGYKLNPKQCIGSIAHLHFQKFNLWTDIGIKWKTDQEPTGENLIETLGKVDHCTCIWRLALYWEGRELWSHSAWDFKEKCSTNLVKHYELMLKVSRKK